MRAAMGRMSVLVSTSASFASWRLVRLSPADTVGLTRLEKLAWFLTKKFGRSGRFPFLRPIRDSLQYSPKDYHLVVQLHLEKNRCNMPPDACLVVSGEKMAGLYDDGYSGDFPLDEISLLTQ